MLFFSFSVLLLVEDALHLELCALFLKTQCTLFHYWLLTTKHLTLLSCYSSYLNLKLVSSINDTGADRLNNLNLQERVVKVVLFILSFQRCQKQPFLIITTASDLPLWEAQFSRWASSENIVVYTGNKDIRSSIKTLEFYNEGGCIMFQVLITLPQVFAEVLIRTSSSFYFYLTFRNKYFSSCIFY